MGKFPPPWVPEVRRPLNPDFAETWDAMSPAERRWSFLIDAAVVAVVLCIGAFFYG